MDFHAEAEKRKQQHLGQIYQLSYERYDLSKKVESAQTRIAEIDSLIAEREAMLMEVDLARRNFDTYVAVKEGAVTLEQLQKAAASGEPLVVPPGAVTNLEPEEEAEKKA